MPDWKDNFAMAEHLIAERKRRGIAPVAITSELGEQYRRQQEFTRYLLERWIEALETIKQLRAEQRGARP